MYYPYSENKGADQLRGDREADLRLCFRICKKTTTYNEAHLVQYLHNFNAETTLCMAATLVNNFGRFSRCVALPNYLAFYFDKTFKVVSPGIKGQLWCIRTGWMEAAKFEVVGGSDKIWLGCSYNFCSLPDETLCDDVSSDAS